MKLRLIISSAFTLLLSVLCFLASASGQQMTQGGDGIDRAMPDTANGTAIGSIASSHETGSRVVDSTPGARVVPDVSSKQVLMHRIALLEAAGKQAEVAHASDVEIGRIYTALGLLYGDAAMWERSVDELEHAVALFRHAAASGGDLATALSSLGRLHAVMGKLRESEREELEALKRRQERGDRLQMARSWGDLAALYLRQHKFAKAREFGQQATDEFVVNGRATVSDRISARYVLSLALCLTKDCPSAIPLLKLAVDEARATLKPEDYPIGLSEFLLGYAYWKSGDLSSADKYMQRGTVQMSAQLGWGHPVYLNALVHYDKFLRESRRMEDANVVERRIRQAEAVVDVQSLRSRSGVGNIAGLP
jgi:tetratricopeptide (TPR) repeat protein